MLLSISILWTLKWAEYVFNILAYIGVFLGQICILGYEATHIFYTNGHFKLEIRD